MLKRLILIPIAVLFVIGCARRETKPEALDGTNTVTIEIEPSIWDSAKIERVLAEEYFTMAINLISEGYYADAVEYLKLLIDNQVYDKFVFRKLLNVYIEMIPQYEMWGNETDLLNILNEALTYAELAAEHFPEDELILYDYTDITRYAGDEDGFYAALDQLLALNPNDVYANYYYGALMYVNNRLEDAVPYLQNVVVNSDDTDYLDLIKKYNALNYLSMISIQFNDYESAIVYMEMVTELDGSNYEMLQYLGWIYALFLDFESAKDNLESIPTVYITDELAEVISGVLLVTEYGDIVDSEPDTDAVEKLTELADDYRGESSFVRGIDEFLNENYDAALDELSVDLFQDSTLFYQYYLKYLIYQKTGTTNKMVTQAYLLGNLAKQVGKYELAATFYEMVQQKSNAAPDIYWLIGSLYDDALDYDQALTYYRKYIDYPGEKDYESSALVRMAYLYTLEDDIDNATNILTSAKAMADTQREIYVVNYYSGLINMELGFYEDALDDFYQAQTNSTNGTQMTYYIGSILVHLNRMDEAVDMLTSARKSEPNSADINNLLAYTYAIKGTNLYEAETLIELALLQDPENIAYLDTLGWIYYQREEYEEALDVFSEIETMIDGLESVSGMDEIYYHIGMIYEVLDQSVNALIYYRLGITNNPDNALILERIDALE